MITSKQIMSVCEKYFDSKNVGGVNIQVFTNPDYSDWKELLKNTVAGGKLYLRFAIDGNNQKIYVWDGFDTLHSDFVSMNNNPFGLKLNNMVLGLATMRSGETLPTATEWRQRGDADYDWVSKYLKVSRLLRGKY